MMRKQITGNTPETLSESRMDGKGNWLDLELLAEVEVSSEAPGFPAEGALVPGSSRGWQAGSPGEARLVLRFDTPVRVARVLLHCLEPQHERSQEWALSAQLANGKEREVLRQGWNFSPGGSTEQREVYTLNLSDVRALSLWIDPDRGRDRYPATLVAWRVSSGV